MLMAANRLKGVFSMEYIVSEDPRTTFPGIF